jgi:hypothetical protein
VWVLDLKFLCELAANPYELQIHRTSGARKDKGDLQRCQGNAKGMAREHVRIGVAGMGRRWGHIANFVECARVIR